MFTTIHTNVFVTIYFISKAVPTTLNLVQRVGIGLEAGGSRFTLTHFQENKAKYIDAIATAFGHPEDRLDVSLKPYSLMELQITFRIETTTKKTNLMNVLNDLPSLRGRLNTQLIAKGTGAMVGGSGITSGAPTNLPSKPMNLFYTI